LARVYENRNSRLLLAALVFVHLIAISRQVDGGGGGGSLLERVVFALLSPPQRAVGSLVRGVSGAFQGYIGLRDVHQDNEQLRDRVRTLETELQQKQQRAQEADRLRELLEIQRLLPFETVAAEVVARDGSPFFRTLTLDKGKDAGVRLNTPVISSSGVLGRVVALGPKAAKVQLLLDPMSGAGVLVERSRVTGLVSGQAGPPEAGAGDLVMKYVSSAADLVVGDVIVTSGVDRIYPKGLVVGRVRSVGRGNGLFKEVLVAPSARFERVEEVLLLKGVKPDSVFTESVGGTR
jgi:rod shape-determining protein MreC